MTPDCQPERVLVLAEIPAELFDDKPALEFFAKNYWTMVLEGRGVQPVPGETVNVERMNSSASGFVRDTVLVMIWGQAFRGEVSEGQYDEFGWSDSATWSPE